jgi:hypothetical protein
MNNVGGTVGSVLNNALNEFSNFLPNLLAGLLLIVIGLIIASLLGQLVNRLLHVFRIDRWIENAEGVFAKAAGETQRKSELWPNIVGTLVKWAIFILFLLPAFDAMGLNRVSVVLNQLILYIPNVFVGVIILFIGIGLARLVYNLVNTATQSLGASTANTLANVARYAIIFFVSLIVLNQLGVAANLVQILFTGIVAMLALAGGLAFGIGGQEKARQLLDSLTQKVNEKRSTAVTTKR